MKLSPYREIAAAADRSWHLGLTDKQIQTMSYDELEGKCYATSSVMSAIDKIAELLELTDAQKERFVEAVFAKDHAEVSEYDKIVFAEIRKKWNEKVAENPKAVVEVLEAIHDNWVKDNVKKFNYVLRDGTKYQHLPIELIGFEEAELDLLFLNPILDAIGVKVSRVELFEAYLSKTAKYLAKHNINSEEDLAKLIAKGAEFYDKLKDKNSAKDTFVFDDKTMAFLKAHKKDKRIINLQYPSVEEREEFEKTVQGIVDEIEREEGAKEHLTVKTVLVSKEEESRKMAGQVIEKLGLGKEETNDKKQ